MPPMSGFWFVLVVTNANPFASVSYWCNIIIKADAMKHSKTAQNLL